MKMRERFEKLITDFMQLKSITKADAETLARKKMPDMAKLADAEKTMPKFDYKADKAKRDEEKALLIAERRIARGEEILVEKAKADMERIQYERANFFTLRVDKRISDKMNGPCKLSRRRAENEVIQNYPYEYKQAQEEKMARE